MPASDSIASPIIIAAYGRAVEQALQILEPVALAVVVGARQRGEGEQVSRP